MIAALLLREGTVRRAEIALVSALLVVGGCSAPVQPTLSMPPSATHQAEPASPSGSSAEGTISPPTASSSEGPQSSAPVSSGPEPAAAPQTSYGLIGQALANGDLDQDHADLYELYAMAGDPALPANYQPAASSHGELPVGELLRIESDVPQMAADVRPLAASFFLSPSDPRSYWTGAGAGATRSRVYGAAAVFEPNSMPARAENDAAAPTYAVLGTTEHTKVWYVPGYGAQNQHVAQVVLDNVETAWRMEATLMAPLGDVQHPFGPVSDSNLPPAGDGEAPPANGGDGLLDIYVGHSGVVPDDDLGSAYGEEVDYPGQPEAEPHAAYILISDRISGFTTPNQQQVDSDTEVRGVLAHEVFHAFQSAVPGWTRASDWFSEASATWAENYVYPTANTEQAYIPGWTNFYGPPPLDKHNFSAEYTNYVFLMYLSQLHGDSVIPDLWNAISDGQTAVQAIQSSDAIGDFATAFKQYAVWTWDEPNTPTDMLRDSGQRLAPKGHDILDFPEDAEDTHVISGIDPQDAHHGVDTMNIYDSRTDLQELSVAYYEVLNPGPNAHRLQVTVDLQGGEPALQALVKLRGQDTYEPLQDWTSDRTHDFCLDRADQNVQAVLLILDNASADTNTWGFVTATASGSPCLHGGGSLTYTANGRASSSQHFSENGVTDHWSGGYSASETAALDMTVTPQDVSDPDAQIFSITLNARGEADATEGFSGAAHAGPSSLSESISGNSSGGFSSGSPPGTADGQLEIDRDPDSGTYSYVLNIPSSWQFDSNVSYNDSGHGKLCTTTGCLGSGEEPPTAIATTETDQIVLPDADFFAGPYDPGSGSIDGADGGSNTDCSDLLGSALLSQNATPWNWIAGEVNLTCEDTWQMTLHLDLAGMGPPAGD